MPCCCCGNEQDPNCQPRMCVRQWNGWLCSLFVFYDYFFLILKKIIYIFLNTFLSFNASMLCNLQQIATSGAPGVLYPISAPDSRRGGDHAHSGVCSLIQVASLPNGADTRFSVLCFVRVDSECVCVNTEMIHSTGNGISVVSWRSRCCRPGCELVYDFLLTVSMPTALKGRASCLPFRMWHLPSKGTPWRSPSLPHRSTLKKGLWCVLLLPLVVLLRLTIIIWAEPFGEVCV